MKKYFLFSMLSMLSLVSCVAQTKTDATTSKAVKVQMQTETFKVSGNCEMCQRTIEGTAKASGAKLANWDGKKDQLTVTFDPNKITLDQIKKNIAAVGYDNDGYKADDKAYEKLPDCCQYDRKSKE